MPTPINREKSHTTYIFNENNEKEADETARLLVQDRSLTQAMESLLPDALDTNAVHSVLDLACGPGGWALDVAHAYPQMEVVGVDLSIKMVRFANTTADGRNLRNASFQVMNVLEPLEFPDDSFDFVNARLLQSFVSKDAWPKLLQECLRITRPGGTIRLIEAEWGFGNGEASEKLSALITQAMWLDGKAFAPQGKMIGITFMISQFLRDLGLETVQQKGHIVEYSAGTPAHETWYQNARYGYQGLAPFLIKKGVTTQEEFDTLYEQALAEMLLPNFCGIFFFVSTWGKKPATI